MKTFHHICLTAHDEVLLRSVEDVAMVTNLTALAAYRTETEVLVDSQMSTHQHDMVLTEYPARFGQSLGISVTKAFNASHGRKGELFDGSPFILEIRGVQHMQMALNYTLRQGLHHGQSETAFSYPWSTCGSLFAKDRGGAVPLAKYTSRSDVRRFLPKNADFPDQWQADENGILLRSSFEQLALVENWYGTARNYSYAMMRRTSEEWLAEQDKDPESCARVTLGMLERGYTPDEVASMLSNECNAKFARREMSDMELCTLIDNEMIGRYGVSSVYALNSRQKHSLAEELRHDVGIRSEKQISRCLVMKYG